MVNLGSYILFTRKVTGSDKDVEVESESGKPLVVNSNRKTRRRVFDGVVDDISLGHLTTPNRVSLNVQLFFAFNTINF